MKQIYNETVVRYARYGVTVNDWHTEPASRLMSVMGWEELDEHGERFAAFARAT